MNNGCQNRKRRPIVVSLLLGMIFLVPSFCAKPASTTSDANRQQAIHLADSMFSIQKIQTYYDSLKSFLTITFPAPTAQSIVDIVFFDSLHGLIASYSNGSPTQGYYQQVGYLQNVQGWKDCEPSLDDIKGKHRGDTIDKPVYSNIYVLATDSVDASSLFRVTVRARSGGAVIAERQLGYSASQQRFLQLITP